MFCKCIADSRVWYQETMPGSTLLGVLWKWQRVHLQSSAPGNIDQRVLFTNLAVLSLETCSFSRQICLDTLFDTPGLAFPETDRWILWQNTWRGSLCRGGRRYACLFPTALLERAFTQKIEESISRMDEQNASWNICWLYSCIRPLRASDINNTSTSKEGWLSKSPSRHSPVCWIVVFHTASWDSLRFPCL